MFAAHGDHAVFTDSSLTLVQAEKDHRVHAIIRHVHADLRSGPLAHFPSGSFGANSAWLVLAAIAFNLIRAAGALTSTFHARATRRELEGIGCQHLTVARVAEGLGVAWNTANDAVLAEGRRVLIADSPSFDGVRVLGVDEHV